ncbi:hypothetical protein, partial [Pantoea sp. B9002]|uniref:hypothetical protein n=1 Tax=Pantoea sp. B9002 TaxID=2726979 RepID=UPI001C4315D5
SINSKSASFSGWSCMAGPWSVGRGKACAALEKGAQDGAFGGIYPAPETGTLPLRGRLDQL